MTVRRVRKIVFLTGTRADFGKLKPLIRVIAEDPDFDYEIFATGMHMLNRYGRTVIEIERSGFDRIYPFVNQDGSINSQMDLVLSHTIQGLAHYVRESKPDLIVVHGDRVEALAGAIVGALNNILVAHIEGGELSGTIDEVIRHAVTKLSHLHFVANEEARLRLLQLGEEPDAISVVGSPEIDVMLSPNLPPLEEVLGRYEIPFREYGILAYHPVTTELETAHERAQEVVRGARASGANFVVIYPNNDAGSDIIMTQLETLRADPSFRLIPSMRFEYFLSLLKNARFIVGNSSAGIREAPVYGVPTINVGSRQYKRFEGPSIVNVPEKGEEIAQALAALPKGHEGSLYFGDGRSAKRFHAVLQNEATWLRSPQKQFVDLKWEKPLSTVL